MRKNEVLIAMIGGVAGAILTMAVGSLAPLGAQDEAVDLNVGKITCTGLKVANGGFVAIVSEDGKIQAVMGDGRNGGYVDVWDKGGHSAVAGMGANFKHGGVVYVKGTNGDLPEASMTASEDEAHVNVFAKDGRLRAYMRINGYDGNWYGAVGTCDKNGDPLATLK